MDEEAFLDKYCARLNGNGQRWIHIESTRLPTDQVALEIAINAHCVAVADSGNPDEIRKSLRRFAEGFASSLIASLDLKRS